MTKTAVTQRSQTTPLQNAQVYGPEKTNKLSWLCKKKVKKYLEMDPMSRTDFIIFALITFFMKHQRQGFIVNINFYPEVLSGGDPACLR